MIGYLLRTNRPTFVVVYYICLPFVNYLNLILDHLFSLLIMGRRKKNDDKLAKPIRGPGRKSKKQGAPTFPKELLLNGKDYSLFTLSKIRPSIFF
jgi:hypothetical protein